MIIEEVSNGYVIKTFSGDSELVCVHHSLENVIKRVRDFFIKVGQEIIDAGS